MARNAWSYSSLACTVFPRLPSWFRTGFVLFVLVDALNMQPPKNCIEKIVICFRTGFVLFVLVASSFVLVEAVNQICWLEMFFVLVSCTGGSVKRKRLV